MEKRLNNDLEKFFEITLEGAITKQGNKDVDLVSYTELLVEIPNKDVNVIVHRVINKYINKYGKDMFDKKLRDAINKGISKVVMVEPYIEVEEYYKKIYGYYKAI